MTLAQERDVWTEYQHATGEERARLEEELVEEHQRLAHFVTNKYFTSRYDREDVLQVAFIGLLKAIRGFDPTTAMQFSTYAVWIMRRDIGHLIRDQFADKRKGEMDNISIHRSVNSPGEREITILDSIADDAEGPEHVADLEGTKQAVSKALNNIGKAQREYFVAHISGNTLTEVAEMYGVTYRAAQVGVSKARRAIRRELEGLL